MGHSGARRRRLFFLKNKHAKDCPCRAAPKKCNNVWSGSASRVLPPKKPRPRRMQGMLHEKNTTEGTAEERRGQGGRGDDVKEEKRKKKPKEDRLDEEKTDCL